MNRGSKVLHEVSYVKVLIAHQHVSQQHAHWSYLHLKQQPLHFRHLKYEVNTVQCKR